MSDGDNGAAITAKEAYEQYHDDGLTQTQIAERAGVTQSHISRLISGYDAGRSDGRTEAKEDIQSDPQSHLDLDDLIEDDSSGNPRTKCPACESMIPKPDTAGTHPCPKCETPLGWDEDEVA